MEKWKLLFYLNAFYSVLMNVTLTGNLLISNIFILLFLNIINRFFFS